MYNGSQTIQFSSRFFSQQKKIVANTATKLNCVNINRNLEFIKILCNSADC